MAQDHIFDLRWHIWTLNLEHVVNFSKKRWKLQCQVLHKRVVLQARPNQPQLRSRSGYTKTIRTGVGWVWLTKSCRAEIGWVCLARLRDRLPCLQRHLGGQYWRTATMPMREWQLCWSVCCGGCQEATLGSSVLNERYLPRFLAAFFLPSTLSVHYTCRAAWEGGPGSRTLSIGRSSSSEKEP